MEKLTEITRSYSQKVKIGAYLTADFFASQKLEVPISEAEEASRAAFHFCKTVVERDVTEYEAEMARKEQADIPLASHIRAALKSQSEQPN